MWSKYTTFLQTWNHHTIFVVDTNGTHLPWAQRLWPPPLYLQRLYSISDLYASSYRSVCLIECAKVQNLRYKGPIFELPSIVLQAILRDIHSEAPTCMLSPVYCAYLSSKGLCIIIMDSSSKIASSPSSSNPSIWEKHLIDNHFDIYDPMLSIVHLHRASRDVEACTKGGDNYLNLCRFRVDKVILPWAQPFAEIVQWCMVLYALEKKRHPF